MMFKKWKAKKARRLLVSEELRIREVLDEMNATIKRRCTGVRPPEQGRRDEDFLDTDQQRQWQILGYEHYRLCRELGLPESIYFNPKRGTYDPDSPIAILQVTTIENEPRDINADMDLWSKDGDNYKAFVRDEEFESAFSKWMQDNDKKFWKNMTPIERYQEQEARRLEWEAQNRAGK